MRYSAFWSGRVVLLAAAATLALGACDKSGTGKLVAADPLAGSPGAAAAEDGEKTLAHELLDELAKAETSQEAALKEEEIWDAWMLSGSPTVDVLMQRGVEAQEAKNLELARDMFDRALMIRPDYAEAWNRRALLYFNDGRYDEAMADLEAALTHEPRHFGAWIGLGMIFESVDAPDAALKAYRNALAIHPHAGAALQGEKRLRVRVEGRQL